MTGVTGTGSRTERPGTAPARVLLTGWFSFLHGEATAGDLLALEAVRDELDDVGIEYDTAWNPAFRPQSLTLETAQPQRSALRAGSTRSSPPACTAWCSRWATGFRRWRLIRSRAAES